MLSDEIKNKVSFIYDGGTLGNTASTLIKIDNNKIIFLREGELTNKIKEDFKEYC
jgi:tRNA A37 threonylcarbamoyladenosine synthetase subunit TsaC/SUA5/YrdC